MKVLHISTATGWRGGEQQAAYLIRQLEILQTTCFLLCPKDAAIIQHLNKYDCKIEVFQKGTALNLPLAIKIKKYCKDNQVYLIHTHDSHAHTAAFLSAWLFGNKCPVVVSRRVDFAVSSSWFSYLKYNHSSIKKIICVSDAIRQITSPAIKRKNILEVVHSVVDTEKFVLGKTKLHQEYQLPKETFLIGNVSALADHKDLFTFIDTAEIILQQTQQVHFFLICDGTEINALQARVAEKKLTDNIHFTGFRNDINELLPELNLFLMTSKTEGLGTTILDAFAAQVPVVATQAGGIPEIVQHEKTGLIAPVGNAKQLATHAMAVMNDRNLAKTLSTNAQQLVSEYTFRRTAEKTKAVYVKVLQEQKSDI